MNRHIIIGFKKGASFKSDLGDVIGIAENLKEAKAQAAKAIKAKDSKVEYCTIVNGKKPCAKVGNRSNVKSSVKVVGIEVMKAEQTKAKVAEAKKK